MTIIPSFRPSISYRQLNQALKAIFWSDIPADIIKRFEQEFAGYLGVKQAISVPSGRWALYYILKGLDLKPEDEVILPAFTYFAVPAAVTRLGLKPVFVDINDDNLNIAVEQIKKNITPKTRAIIPTHLCGFAAEIAQICEIAGQHGIAVIEDCAQSLGAEYAGKKTGAWGDAAYFTFGLTKNFTTFGGGMIATNNEPLAQIIRQEIAKLYPRPKIALLPEVIKGYLMKLATALGLFGGTYWTLRLFSCLGIDIVDLLFHEPQKLLGKEPLSGLLNCLQAQLGLAQLQVLDKNNQVRIKNGLELYRLLQDAECIKIPVLSPKAKNIFSTCPIFLKNKLTAKKLLLKLGIDTSSGYMQNCSQLDIFRQFKKNCPNAAKAETQILHLPINPELKFSDLLFMTNAFKWFGNRL